MNVDNAFRGQVALLERASFTSEARAPIWFLKERKNLGRQNLGILISPNSSSAVFDQLATCGRLATDHGSTVRPRLNVGDAKRFVRRGETKDVTASDSVGFACLIWHSQIPHGRGRQTRFKIFKFRSARSREKQHRLLVLLRHQTPSLQ